MSIEERVRQIVAKQLKKGTSEVLLSSALSRDLGADSLDETELVNAVESEFGLELMQHHDDVRTVGDIVRLVNRAIEGSDAARTGTAVE